MRPEERFAPLRSVYAIRQLRQEIIAPGTIDTAYYGAKKIIKLVFHRRPVRGALCLELLHAHLGSLAKFPKPEHLVISPYPEEYEFHETVKAELKLFVRPVKPEDAPLKGWRGTRKPVSSPPPRQTQHADFPHYAYSVNFS